MYRYPENLFTDVRIEYNDNNGYYVRNGEVENEASISLANAMVRVYDGKMWYTAYTDGLDNIQAEIDNLATLATPNPNIYEDPVIRNFGDYKDDVVRFDGDGCYKKVARDTYVELVNSYIEKCVDPSIAEIKSYGAGYRSNYQRKEYYSSKGAEIKQDIQFGSVNIYFEITVDGVTTVAYKGFQENSFDKLLGKEAEIIATRDKYIDYAKNAVDVEPGEYTCVLAPVVTSMFTHESFGHKSEADYMLNDKTLQDEWVMGKKVGNENVSICDRGDLHNHGYVPYDDEGNKASETWLIKNGVLTGRLHDSKSASILDEKVTGNARAQSAYHTPIVRMTNTFMEKGTDKKEDIIAGVEDGIYVEEVDYGTGMSTFTLAPNLCYRIRNGKIAEPIRVHVVTGSVFETLFEIDAVGDDFVLYNTFTCGKNGQSVPVSAGGPTIRVKKLNVN